MELEPMVEALSLANHDFSFSLYKELAKTETGNIFYSPLSIHVIMFMASIGAANNTFDEMIETIHIDKNAHSPKAYKMLLDEIKLDHKYMKLVTGMFVDKTFKVKDSFVDISKQYLGSSMENLDFMHQPEQQRQHINNWVLHETNDKIRNLFPEGSIDKATALVLANAVHFKSPWEHKFTDSKDDYFYVSQTKKVPVKMMTLQHDLQYYRDNILKFTALEIPYELTAFKMLILLPDARDGLKNLEENFSKIKLHDISDKMTQYNVTVKLPKFKLEQTLELNTILSNLGCPTMFTPAANFSNIVEHNNLYVSKVVHKAYVNVDENGTEAAAASGIQFSLLSAWIPEPKPQVNFFADHPFVFAILSYKNSVLFQGRVSKL